MVEASVATSAGTAEIEAVVVAAANPNPKLVNIRGPNTLTFPRESGPGARCTSGTGVSVISAPNP